jgi:nitronate monooxygenase
MFQTRITELFGIQYPIIQGAMLWISRAELTAAVSNAGGLGILSSITFPTANEMREEIRKTKSLTDKPFAVNITLLPTIKEINIEEYINAALEERVRVFETAGRSPEPYMKRFKDAGAKIMHKTPAVRFAQTAERVGVDAVAILSNEGAAHVGMDGIGSTILIPQAANSLKIPVVAAGGFCDARGFVAALALGAEGILMGTRFMSSKESPIHPKVKEWLLESKETDTMLIQQSIRNTERVLRNKPSEKTSELEGKGASLEELLPIISGLKGKELLEAGNLDAGILACGQVVGLIREIPSVKEIIDEIISGAKTTCHRLQQLSETKA